MVEKEATLAVASAAAESFDMLWRAAMRLRTGPYARSLTYQLSVSIFEVSSLCPLRLSQSIFEVLREQLEW